MFITSGIATTINVTLGFGMHFFEVPIQNLLDMGILSNVSGFTSILAVSLSKTSFAITLLRLTNGWMKWLVWVLLIVLNLTQYSSAIIFWVKCNPPAKTWNPTLLGTCWPADALNIYSEFVGGKPPTPLPFLLPS